MRLHIDIFLVVIMLLTELYPASHYVRTGATGNGSGSDWNNAYIDLPTTLVRADTYYVADGNYSSYEFNDAVSGTDTIWVLKATASAHGTDTGWQSSYGDGQAIFADRFRFTTSYWYVSGAVGGGHGLYADTTSYGFKVAHTGNSNQMKNVRFDNSCHNIYYAHIDHTYTQNYETDLNTATDQDSWYSLGCSYVTTAYCSFRYSGRVNVFLMNCSNLTFEYCYFYYPKTCASQHSESWADQGSSNIVCRHSVFRKNKGTGVIVVLSRGGISTSDNWEIYGNTFWGGERQGYDVTDGVICVINNQVANNWQVYNNTIFNMIGVGTDTGIDFSEGDITTGNHQVYNNLFYNNENPTTKFSPGDISSISDYNYFSNNTTTPSEPHGQISSGDPFNSWSNYDFSLKIGTNDGYILQTPYNTDPAGNIRGADGHWDRGAYEFTGNIIARPTTPTGCQVENIE